LFVIWSVFYPLYFCTVTAMRSSMSKMIGPGEIGKVFAALGVLEKSMELLVKPVFGYLYKVTVAVFPATWILVCVALLCLALLLVLPLHLATPRPAAGPGPPDQNTQAA